VQIYTRAYIPIDGCSERRIARRMTARLSTRCRSATLPSTNRIACKEASLLRRGAPDACCGRASRAVEQGGGGGASSVEAEQSLEGAGHLSAGESGSGQRTAAKEGRSSCIGMV